MLAKDGFCIIRSENNDVDMDVGRNHRNIHHNPLSVHREKIHLFTPEGPNDIFSSNQVETIIRK